VNNSKNSKMKKYRAMLRRRRLFYAAFFPVAIVTLFLSGGGIPGVSAALVWPLLLIFMIGCVMLFQSIDTCPWCQKSFHSSWKAGAQSNDFKSLVRRQCANCGEPQQPPKPASTP